MISAAAALAGVSESCPHPDSRARGVIVVRTRRGNMALCQSCYRGLTGIARAADAGELGPRQVVAQVVELGYTRASAAAFVLGLYARRLRVRLGFREAA